MGVLRKDGVFLIQLQSTDKGFSQFGQEVKRTTQECNMSTDRFTTGKTGNCLVDNCLENRS